VFGLRKPSRRQAHIAWLIVAAALALFVTRGAVPAVFLAAFFVLWLIGYWILVSVRR
jgi:hypothetical protein